MYYPSTPCTMQVITSCRPSINLHPICTFSNERTMYKKTNSKNNKHENSATTPLNQTEVNHFCFRVATRNTPTPYLHSCILIPIFSFELLISCCFSCNLYHLQDQSTNEIR